MQSILKQLGNLSVWVAGLALLLGVITKLSGRDVIFSGNDYWQAGVALGIWGLAALYDAAHSG